MASNNAMKTIAITTREERSVSNGFIRIVNIVNYSGGFKENKSEKENVGNSIQIARLGLFISSLWGLLNLLLINPVDDVFFLF